MGSIKTFKNWYADYQHQRLLKKFNWTQEDYLLNNDCRINRCATAVTEHYHGYPYIHVFESPNSGPFVRYESWYECYQEIKEWCKANCQEPWRNDILRVDLDSTNKSYELCDFTGKDAVFFVFQNQRDYVGFLLKWA